MRVTTSLDCIVIGYYEPPFEQYERLIRSYGEHSEAYRDLQFSFVDVNGRKLNYVDLLNHVCGLGAAAEGRADPSTDFKSGDIPNLAAVYLANFLRKRGLRAKYINLFEYQKDLLARLLSEGPLCVAITTTFYVLDFPVIEIVKFIRRHNADTKIIVGGPLIANHFRNSQFSRPAIVPFPESGNALSKNYDIRLKTALEEIGADIYIIEAQGEQTLCRLLNVMRDGSSIREVANIAYFDQRTLYVTPKSPENNSLDENFIEWTDFEDDDLGPTIQTRTARSCAFSCSFCNYPARAGKLTTASLESIRAELDSIRALGNVTNLVFVDDTFNVPLGRFKDICRLIIQGKYTFNWFSYFRCSNSDEEAIELMARSGCKGVFLGIESGSPQILQNMNKAATIEKYAQGMRLLRDHGILTFASFIAGFPGETAETIEQTVEFIKLNRPDYYRTQLWYCEPGTPIEREREKYRIEGNGFVWAHATMASLEAMDHIDRMFLQINNSSWLPQWSFDFWIIPYLLGRGMSLSGFRDFMLLANRLLALEIASVSASEKARRQREYLAALTSVSASWNFPR